MTAAATKKQRRATPRKRSSKVELKEVKKAKKQEGDGQPDSWIRELAVVVCTISTLFICCSILSAKFKIGAEDGSENVMGPVGGFVGDNLIVLMGWCSLIVPLWLIATVYVLKKDENSGSYKMARLVGVFGTCLASCTALAVFGRAEAGGAIGDGIASTLIELFGTAGTLLMAGCALLLFLAPACQMSVSDLVKTSGKDLVKGAKLGAKGSVAGCSLLGRAAGATCSWISEFVSGPKRDDYDDEEEEEEEERGFKFGDEEYDEEDYDEEAEIKKGGKFTLFSKPKKKPKKEELEEEEYYEDDEYEEYDDDEYDEDEYEEEEEHEVVVKRYAPPVRKEKKVAAKKDEVVARGLFHYTPPSLKLLQQGEVSDTEDDDELFENSRIIEETLNEFKITGHVTEVHPGPVVTMYEYEPTAGIRVSKIAALQDDLARSLRSTAIRIIAPLPRKSTVGIEVPNHVRDIVRLRDLLESDAFCNSSAVLSVPIGKNVYGEPVVTNIAKMPHLLVAGTTGTGKSVFINSILVSLLYHANPADLGMILIDPKQLEFSVYEGIPHLMVPVVTVAKQARAVLEWAVSEMNRRYRVMKQLGVRNIDGYNARVNGEDETEASDEADGVVLLKEDQLLEEGNVQESLDFGVPIAPKKLSPMPRILIVVDEFAELIKMEGGTGRDIELYITSLAQKARAAGIHLILATQRPSVDVITGLIKSNFPARIAFRVASVIDSRTILDSKGAEKLLGNGDMLLQLPGEYLQRAHGALVEDDEVEKVVVAAKKSMSPQYNQEIIEVLNRANEEEDGGSSGGEDDEEHDAFYDKAVEFAIEKQQVSTSSLQRAFRIGYNRAARIIDMMEREGVIGPQDGARPREVLISSYDEEE